MEGNGKDRGLKEAPGNANAVLGEKFREMFGKELPLPQEEGRVGTLPEKGGTGGRAVSLFGGADGSEGSRGEYIRASYPRRIASALEGAVLTPVQEAVVGKIVGERRSGVVIGQNGTGKTLVMCRSQVDLAERGVQAKTLNAFEMFDRIRGIMDRKESVLRYMQESWAVLPCLLIDEIDKAFGSQLEFLYFARLVDMRYEAMLQTVVFGNFADWGECVSKIGQSAFDRLSNGGDGFMANLKGRSFRQQGPGEKPAGGDGK